MPPARAAIALAVRQLTPRRNRGDPNQRPNPPCPFSGLRASEPLLRDAPSLSRSLLFAGPRHRRGSALLRPRRARAASGPHRPLCARRWLGLAAAQPPTVRRAARCPVPGTPQLPAPLARDHADCRCKLLLLIEEGFRSSRSSIVLPLLELGLFDVVRHAAGKAPCPARGLSPLRAGSRMAFDASVMIAWRPPSRQVLDLLLSPHTCNAIHMRTAAILECAISSPSELAPQIHKVRVGPSQRRRDARTRSLDSAGRPSSPMRSFRRGFSPSSPAPPSPRASAGPRRRRRRHPCRAATRL